MPRANLNANDNADHNAGHLLCIHAREIGSSGLCRQMGGVPPPQSASPVGMELWLRMGEHQPLRFRFEDSLRADMATTVAALTALGIDKLREAARKWSSSQASESRFR